METSRSDAARNGEPSGSGYSSHSTLVAIRALFGVVTVRRNAKHVVALDAHAMQCALRMLAFFRFRRRMLVGFRGHEWILHAGVCGPQYSRELRTRSRVSASSCAP